MKDLSMKYSFSILFLIFAICGYSQSRDLPADQKPGACYAKCIIPSSTGSKKFSSEIKEYPVYIGANPENVKTKTITIEVRPPKHSWLAKINDNCESENENDCLEWNLIEAPGEYLELTIAKNKRKLKEADLAYSVVEVFTSAYSISENSVDWREVLCPSKMSKEFIRELKKRLAEKGFEHESTNQAYDYRTKLALKRYQQYHKLPIGQLNFETLKRLELGHYL